MLVAFEVLYTLRIHTESGPLISSSQQWDAFYSLHLAFFGRIFDYLAYSDSTRKKHGIVVYLPSHCTARCIHCTYMYPMLCSVLRTYESAEHKSVFSLSSFVRSFVRSLGVNSLVVRPSVHLQQLDYERHRQQRTELVKEQMLHPSIHPSEQVCVVARPTNGKNSAYNILQQKQGMK